VSCRRCRLPAERAGFTGRQILSIDGETTRDMTLGEALQRMRGAPGTRVVLEIMRTGSSAAQADAGARPRPDAERRVAAARRRAAARLRPREGLQTGPTGPSARRSTTRGRPSRGDRGLVLDLRNNPAASAAGVRVSDLWLAQGSSSPSRDGARPTWRSSGRGRRRPSPLSIVVLVNKGTASPANLAGACRTTPARAPGRRRSGRGRPVDHRAGGRLRPEADGGPLLHAEATAPSRPGIAPDIAVEPPAAAAGRPRRKAPPGLICSSSAPSSG